MMIFVNLKSPLHLQLWLRMPEAVFPTGLLCNSNHANSIILTFLPSRIERSTDPDPKGRFVIPAVAYQHY